MLFVLPQWFPLSFLPLWSSQGLGGGDDNGFACLTDYIHQHELTGKSYIILGYTLKLIWCHKFFKNGDWVIDKVNICAIIYTYFKIFEDISPFCGDTDTPVLDFPWYLPGVLKDGSLACVFYHPYAMHSSDSPLVPHVLTSWRFDWKIWSVLKMFLEKRQNMFLCVCPGRSAGSWNRPCRVISGAALGYKSLCEGGSNVTLDWM